MFSAKSVSIAGKEAKKITFNGALLWEKESGMFLDYIESTGIQYIDSGVFINQENNFTIQCDFDILTTATQFVYGANNGAYNNNEFSSIIQYSHISCNNSQTKPNGAGLFISTTPLTVSITARKNGFVINGNTYAYPDTSQNATPSVSPFIFARNQNGTPTLLGTLRMRRWAKILDNIGIEIELLPYRTSDGVVCMKDTVSGGLYLNRGSGVFLAPEQSNYAQSLRRMGIQPDASSEESMSIQLEKMGVV